MTKDEIDPYWGIQAVDFIFTGWGNGLTAKDIWLAFVVYDDMNEFLIEHELSVAEYYEDIELDDLQYLIFNLAARLTRAARRLYIEDPNIKGLFTKSTT